MPELPEVETTCKGIEPHLVGHLVTSVSVEEHRLRWPVDEEIYQLKNVKVLSVSRRAKYILIQFEHGFLIIHLGMSGSLRICSPDTELRKHDHLIFNISSGVQMRYHDPRRFGCALWSEEPLSHKLLSKLGPEPLEEEFSLEYFYQKLSSFKSPIKQVIMNNAVVVGVGNIYACESLFLSCISPKRAANTISKKRIQLLHSNIVTVLERAIKMGGTTLRDFVNQDGQPGYFQQQLYVYNREGEKCNNCESCVKRITQAQRSTFYCSKCQR